MHTHHFLKYSLITLFLSALYACKPDTVYYTYDAIDTDGWKKNDTLLFELPDTISAGTYHLDVGVRHTGKYHYRDLWLELTQYVPCEKDSDEWVAKKDTIHIYLANENGSWNGSGTTSGHFQLLSPSGDIHIPKNQSHDPANLVHDSETDKNYQSRTKQSPKKKYTFEGKQHKLNKDSKYQLKVIHIMTDTLLLHISDIGLQLTRQ